MCKNLLDLETCSRNLLVAKIGVDTAEICASEKLPMHTYHRKARGLEKFRSDYQLLLRLRHQRRETFLHLIDLLRPPGRGLVGLLVELVDLRVSL